MYCVMCGKKYKYKKDKVNCEKKHMQSEDLFFKGHQEDKVSKEPLIKASKSRKQKKLVKW